MSETTWNTGPVRIDLRWASKFFLMAAASQGWPFWNVTPGRVLMVHTVKSSFGVIDSARKGLATPSVSYSAM